MNSADSFGIYCIENVRNGRIYIGNTSMPFSERFRRHRLNLQRGGHGNRLLQKEWRMYGAEVFQFGILEALESITELLDRELYWLALHLRICPRDELYNVSRVDEALVWMAAHDERPYQEMPRSYGKAKKHLRLTVNEDEAIARMIEHKVTAEKPTKASIIWAGFGLKKGASLKYQRASEIYDTLFVLPEKDPYPLMTEEQQEERERLGLVVR